MTLLESLIIDLRRLHDALDRSLDGLSSDQLHMVPAGHARANTIAERLLALRRLARKNASGMAVMRIQSWPPP